MPTKLRLICEICGKHFSYDYYKKETYKETEKEYFLHYKKEHNIDLG